MSIPNRKHRSMSLQPSGSPECTLVATRMGYMSRDMRGAVGGYMLTSDDSLNNFLDLQATLAGVNSSPESPSLACSIDNMVDVDEIRAMADEELARTPLRMPRKKSVSTLAELRLTDQLGLPMESVENSNQNSITSINSLASLLREKMQMVPAIIKKNKKPNVDYKVRAFVGILFLVIVFLVGFAYVMYHQKILAKSYFEKVQFNKMKRSLKIFDETGEVIINGELGTTLRSDRVFPCHTEDEDTSNSGRLCLEWIHNARLYLDHEDDSSTSAGNLKCYGVTWEAISHDLMPTDCYDWSGPAHWLANETRGFKPFITGKNWGNVLKRYFINSKGAAILVSDSTPLHVSLDNGKLCLRAKRDEFAFASSGLRSVPLVPLRLSYRICCAPDVRELHLALAERSLWDGLKEEDIGVINSLLAEPVWQIAPQTKEELTEAAVYNYTEAVIALGFLKQGHVLISELWQLNNGDLSLDTTRFQSLHETVDIMHRRGFRILLSIQPFISTESPSFAECLKGGHLVGERDAPPGVPALVRYGMADGSSAVLDATSPEAVDWMTRKLNDVIEKYKVDGFYMDYGTAEDMPPHYRFRDRTVDPDGYKTLLTERLSASVVSVSSPLASASAPSPVARLAAVAGAVRSPRPPIFVALPAMQATWTDLGRVLPGVLSYGVIGYQFLIPGAVGGDFGTPEKELYIRWLQLATFLPVVKFAQLPGDFKDAQVLEIARSLTGLRQRVVTPLLKKYSRQALDVGLPLVRPLWLLEPQDAACLTLTDEFSVGEELIVAPVLEKGVTNREVYLPAGVWKDGIDGSLRKGSRWIHGYKVPLDQVAYFMRMPDNTRF